jgi:hypothetical protein
MINNKMNKNLQTVHCNSLDRLLGYILDDTGSAVQKWKRDSVAFSKFWSTKPFAKKIISMGGFGKILVPLTYDGKTLHCFTNYFSKLEISEIVIKTNRKISKNDLVMTRDHCWLADSNYAESYFAAFIKYVAYHKTCPFLCNYLSSFLTEKGKTVTMIEKYNCDLRTLMISENVSSDQMINIIFQFVYTIYILKSYLGIIHYDTHLRNVMIVKQKQSKYKYIMLYDKFRKQGILFPFLEYFIKIIDFGLCSIDLNESVDPFLKRNLKISSLNVAEELVSDQEKNATLDFQYFILHLWQMSNQSNKDAIDKFCEIFYEDVSKTPKNIIENDKRLVINQENCIIKTHDVGLKGTLIKNRHDLIDGLMRYCTYSGNVIKDNENIVYSLFPLDNIPSFNEIYVVHPTNPKHVPKFIEESKWFKKEFFQINEEKVGYRWIFNIKHHKPFPSKEIPRTGIILKNKTNQPDKKNAYLSFSGPNSTLRFHALRKHAESVKSFFCGTFIVHNAKEITSKGYGRLFFLFRQEEFVVVYFINKLISYRDLLHWSKSFFKDVISIIDASETCSFIYEKEIFNQIPKSILNITF